MAIVPRLLRSGKTVYWVVFSWLGEDVWERSGTDKREADRLETQRKREVRDGTYMPPKNRKATKTGPYLEQWGSERTNKTAKDDRQRLRDYVLVREWLVSMPLRDVRPMHIIQLVKELQATDMAPKTVSNTYGAVRTAFHDAVIKELIPVSPCVLPHGLIKRRRRKEPIPYEQSEAMALTRSGKLAPDLRVLAALAFYTGMREGEVCGRRWSDWDRKPKPLGCMSVFTQYGGEKLKTDSPRKVPVHPDLDAILTEWLNVGFELVHCRKPTPGDFIVPMRKTPRNACKWKPHHTRSSAYKAFDRACQAVGVTHKTLHATRNTAITWMRRGGADKSVVERITHNAAGDIVDQYTTYDWQPLCDAVNCLVFDPRQDLRRPNNTPSNSGGAPVQRLAANGAESQVVASCLPGSIPGASIAERLISGFDSRTDQAASQGPEFRRLPPDVQDFVAQQIAEAYPLALDPSGGERILKPLRRAAKAIDRGRPKRSA